MTSLRGEYRRSAVGRVRRGALGRRPRAVRVRGRRPPATGPEGGDVGHQDGGRAAPTHPLRGPGGGVPAVLRAAVGMGGRHERSGGLLRLLRDAAGLAQEELAERSGPGARAVGNLERGRARPRADSLRRIVRAPGLAGRDAPGRGGRRPCRACRPTSWPGDWTVPIRFADGRSSVKGWRGGYVMTLCKRLESLGARRGFGDRRGVTSRFCLRSASVAGFRVSCPCTGICSGCEVDPQSGFSPPSTQEQHVDRRPPGLLRPDAHR
ncbi:helix-turn-helix domain-containing protein [Kitasatospora sp. NPDC058170]|uniref:helix-turn-helix domain-containing protein n=1 Tax=Kitasatospora sp. NPDC058170 TaxID=3346364 RepID=UPI0036D92897